MKAFPIKKLKYFKLLFNGFHKYIITYYFVLVYIILYLFLVEFYLFK